MVEINREHKKEFLEKVNERVVWNVERNINHVD